MRTMRRHARYAGLLALATIALALIVALASCMPSRPRVFYNSPLHGDSVEVRFDAAVQVWMNGQLNYSRLIMQETGACLHVARSVADTFYVDSMEAANRGPGLQTWANTAFICPPETAPIHWHVLIKEMFPALQAIARDNNVNDSLPTWTVRDRCQFSEADTNGYWSRYPFVVMQCGFGPDSVHIYRVRKR